MFKGKNTATASTGEISEVAASYGVETEMLQAVAEVESSGRGFWKDGTVVRRFEAHIFSNLTDGKYDMSHPRISTPGWPNNCDSGPAALDEAIALDSNAALLASSFGAYQVMGFNFKVCGFASVDSFLEAHLESEKSQLDAVMRFITGAGLLDELVRRDFTGFARGFNGAAYYIYGYHTKLARAYHRRKAGLVASTAGGGRPRPLLVEGMQGDDVAVLQAALNRSGMVYTLKVDGIFGPDTREAVFEFQEKNSLYLDGKAGPVTMNALKPFMEDVK